MDKSEILSLLRPYIEDQRNGKIGSIAIMMCGVAGSGKSTLSYAIVDAVPSFTRLSIDAIIAERHGIYSIDYPASEYSDYQDEAAKLYAERCHKLLAKKENIVLDRSFYSKKHRDEYKVLVERAGGRWVLIYFKAERDLLWKRICERKAKVVNADSALDISPSLLDQYFHGFEIPDGEGEFVIDVV